MLILRILTAGFSLLEGAEAETTSSSEQSAAERGIIQTSRDSGNASPLHSIRTRLTSIVIRSYVFLVYWVLILSSRFCLGMGSLYGYTFDWGLYIIRRQSKDTLVIALAITNFVTMLLFYIKQFDGTGTYVPAWTSILG
ncbi:hypothetical protein BX600DRAFT_473731 [Xylariales sp. PMI_506]|nr:hypothetical protein BX600DRAFT_473731 [Xylariales sp. PMI_506]